MEDAEGRGSGGGTTQPSLSSDGVLYSKSGGVATVTINHPEVLNAFTRVDLQEIYLAIMDAARDGSVGVVVLRGAGDNFSSGGNVRWELEARTDESLLPLLEVREAMRRCLKPLVAAVKGYAIGGGNHLAYWCDLTLASETAIFGQNGANVGSPAGGYPVTGLTAVIGQKRAREMWYLCRRYTAREMLEWGLVNWVVADDDFEQALSALCNELLDKSPTTLKLLKWSFDSSLDHLRPYDAKMVQNWLAPEYPGSDESKEGAQAYIEKRKPNFRQYRK